MATYYKPQSPIQSGEDFIYPITTADQIVKSDNSRRLEQAGLIVADNSTSLGGVAAKDYALKTDTAPDSSKLGGKAPEYYIQPRNLLDNSDFRNPVNQRGFVSGESVAVYNYFIDRWINGEELSIAPNMSSNGIKPNGAFYQDLDSLASYVGKKMTFAVGLSSGNVVTASGTLTEATTDDVTIFDTKDGSNRIIVGSDGGLWYVWIDYPSSTIQWAALYEGEYTADTLPPYVPKGYAAELTACNSAPVDLGGGYGGGSLQAYPVGSIYMSVSDTSPASLFGGTWEILNDVFLLAAGSYANAGTFGGEATHQLTVNEIPSHAHGCGVSQSEASGQIAGSNMAITQFSRDYGYTSYVGGGQPHNNMPPYMAVYMWKRVN